MAARSSDLDDQKPGSNIQTDGHTLKPPSGWNGPEDQEAFGSTPSHSPSQSLTRKLTPDWPETNYCLEIQVTSTEDGGSDTTTPSHVAGTHCGRHCMRWQIQPDRSHSDQARQGHSVLRVAIIRRRTELGQGTRCHIHTVQSHQLGWQTNPTQHQTGKPGWWSSVDYPSHHQRTHQTKRAWSPSFHSACLNTIQFS